MRPPTRRGTEDEARELPDSLNEVSGPAHQIRRYRFELRKSSRLEGDIAPLMFLQPARPPQHPQPVCGIRRLRHGSPPKASGQAEPLTGIGSEPAHPQPVRRGAARRGFRTCARKRRRQCCTTMSEPWGSSRDLHSGSSAFVPQRQQTLVFHHRQARVCHSGSPYRPRGRQLRSRHRGGVDGRHQAAGGRGRAKDRSNFVGGR